MTDTTPISAPLGGEWESSFFRLTNHLNGKDMSRYPREAFTGYGWYRITLYAHGGIVEEEL